MDTEIEVRYSDYYDSPMEDPNESPVLFARYKMYRDMNPRTRSLRDLTEILNSSGTTISYKAILQASSKYKWAIRAQAYDLMIEKRQIELVEADNVEAIEYLLQQENIELITVAQIVQQSLANAVKSVNSSDPEERLDAMDITRLVKATQMLQDMRRRNVGLPTEYKSAQANELDLEGKTYVIGGTNG